MIKFKANPVRKVRITSPFGTRKHPVTGRATKHNGIDFGAETPGREGDPLFAVADGEVIISKVNSGGPTKGYGYYTVIQHGKEFATLYGHLKGLVKKVGDRVKAGEIIGYMGNSGTSTAPHLHFSVTAGRYDDMIWVDPAPYLLKGNQMDITQAIHVLKTIVGLSDDTIKYLTDYKYGEDLIKKLAMSVGKG